jgi:hypothetical protein
MSRPKKEMPMIRHQAMGGDADLGLSVSLCENLLKGGVVGRLFEQRESADAPV